MTFRGSNLVSTVVMFERRRDSDVKANIHIDNDHKGESNEVDSVGTTVKHAATVDSVTEINDLMWRKRSRTA